MTRLYQWLPVALPRLEGPLAHKRKRQAPGPKPPKEDELSCIYPERRTSNSRMNMRKATAPKRGSDQLRFRGGLIDPVGSIERASSCCNRNASLAKRPEKTDAFSVRATDRQMPSQHLPNACSSDASRGITCSALVRFEGDNPCAWGALSWSEIIGVVWWSP